MHKANYAGMQAKRVTRPSQQKREKRIRLLELAEARPDGENARTGNTALQRKGSFMKREWNKGCAEYQFEKEICNKGLHQSSVISSLSFSASSEIATTQTG